MVEKLKILLSNDKLLEEFSQNARKRALDFSGEKIIHELENFLLWIEKA